MTRRSLALGCLVVLAHVVGARDSFGAYRTPGDRSVIRFSPNAANLGGYQPDMAVLEPLALGHLIVATATYDRGLQYSAVSLADYSPAGDNTLCNVPDLRTRLEEGFGVWDILAHGGKGLHIDNPPYNYTPYPHFVVETFTTFTDWSDRLDELHRLGYLITNLNDDGSYRDYDPELIADRHMNQTTGAYEFYYIGVTSRFIQEHYKDKHSLVYLAGCDVGPDLADGFVDQSTNPHTGRAVFEGYDYPVTTNVAETEANFLFETAAFDPYPTELYQRTLKQIRDDYQSQCAGCPQPMSLKEFKTNGVGKGEDNMTMKPMVVMQVPERGRTYPSTPSAGETVQITITFDTVMDNSVTPTSSIVHVEGSPVASSSATWNSDATSLTVSVLLRDSDVRGGSIKIRLRSGLWLNPTTWLNGIQSLGGVALDGNTNSYNEPVPVKDPWGAGTTNGKTPSGDSFETYVCAYGPGCDPTNDAATTAFKAVLAAEGGTDLSWWAEEESGIAEYLVERSSFEGAPYDTVHVIAPAGGGWYGCHDSEQGSRYRLREVTTENDTLFHAEDATRNSPYVQSDGTAPPDSAYVDSLRAAQYAAYPTPTIAVPVSDIQWACFVPQAWKAAVQPLANYWRGRGHPSEVYSLESVGGAANINSFLHTLPAVRYVLLIGDASDYQYWNNAALWAPSTVYQRPWAGTAEGAMDIIPMGKYVLDSVSPLTGVPIQFPYWCSDWTYGDVTGDGIPDISVGRVPARNAAEVTTFVEKTTTAASQAGAIPLEHVGVWTYARDNGLSSGLTAHSIGLSYARAFPANRIVDVLEDNDQVAMTGAARNAASQAAFGAGRSLVVVSGTGSTYWSWCGWVDAADNPSPWSGATPWPVVPFVLGANCSIGAIDCTPVPLPAYSRPLVETGLITEKRGPWGCLAPMRGSTPQASAEIANAFLAEALRPTFDPGGILFEGNDTLTCGDFARRAVASVMTSDPGFRRIAESYVFLGDPLVQLRTTVPLPRVTISGPDRLGHDGVQRTWTASASGGDGAYSFNWYRRIWSGDEWSSAGSGSTMTWAMGGADEEVRCDVLSAGMAGSDTVCVAYTGGPASITASISGPNQLACGDTGTWSTSPAGGQTCGQYSYEWRPSTDNGATWGPVVGTASSYSASYSNSVMLKVTVRAVNNIAQTSPTLAISVPCDGGGGGCPTVDVLTAGGWTQENTILGRSTTGGVLLDDYRLKSSPDSSTGHVSLRVRENEQEYTTLDEVRLIAVDHSLSTRAYGAGEKVLLGVPVPAARVMKSSGEDVTSQVNGGSGYAGQPGDTLIVDQVSLPPAGSASVSVGTRPSATQGGGGGGDIIDDGGGKGAQPIASNLRRPKPGAATDPDVEVLSTSGIIVQAPDGQGGWQTITHYYPRESPDGAVLDTVGYDRLRLVFVGQHSIRFLGHLERATEPLVATKLPLLTAMHSRYGNVSGAVSALGNVTTDLAPGDTVNLAFQNVALEPGKMRDLFLLSNGVYTSNLPAGARPADPPIPIRYALYRNRPNPFSAATTIRFDLPRGGNVKLEVFDLQGRLVKTLANRPYEAGTFSIAWAHTSDSGQPMRPGIYMYRMIAGGFRAQEKMLLLP